VVHCLRPITQLPLEVHLMVDQPDRFLEDFAKAGADSIIVHQENGHHLHRTVQNIRSLGKCAGVALNPATPPLLLEEILPDVDLILVMTVNPGSGGQEFIYNMLSKIRRTREMIDDLQPACELEVDGGIDAHTAALSIEAGATVLVAGTSIFRSKESIAAAMERLREQTRAHENMATKEAHNTD
jgi:ribulose-phosphate 3-epimerase